MDEETQKTLNTPLKADFKFDPVDEEILGIVIELVNSGKINLYRPSSLVNQNAYEQMDSVKRGQVDFESMNLLAAIREIKDLCDAGFNGTYQVANLVGRMRATKERIEGERGNIFII